MIDILKAEQKDQQTILELSNEAFGVGYLRAKDFDPLYFYVATNCGTVIGYSMWSMYSPDEEVYPGWRDSVVVFVDQVVVTPHFRKCGVGEKLIRYLVDHHKRLGAKYFESHAWEYSDTKNVPLAKPLEAVGFVKGAYMEECYVEEHGPKIPCTVCGSQCKCSAWMYTLDF